jgi:NAD(P)-dependent dehydrogenase (short-subunit alcohol dehydrogenase family)
LLFASVVASISASISGSIIPFISESIMEVSGKTILVTGAASGLGAACALRLAGCGAHVLALDLQEGSSPAAGPSSGRLRHLRCDVAEEDDVQRVLDIAVKDGASLHGVVNCAGILRAGRTVSRQGPYPLDEFQAVIRVNLIGTFNVVRLAAARMMHNAPLADGERGVVINTSSVAAFDGQIGQSAYAASKGGVAALTLPLARELGNFGIRVVAIAPGIFETPMMQNTPETVRTSLARQIPFPQRFGRPDEFAALVQHIFENQMLNGCVLRLDGGVRMQAK